MFGRIVAKPCTGKAKPESECIVHALSTARATRQASGDVEREFQFQFQFHFLNV